MHDAGVYYHRKLCQHRDLILQLICKESDMLHTAYKTYWYMSL